MGSLLWFGLDFGNTANLELRHKALRIIHREVLARSAIQQDTVAGEVERLREALVHAKLLLEAEALRRGEKFRDGMIDAAISQERANG